MKRLLCILFTLFLLAGCTGNLPETTVPETTLPETTVPATEPAIPWIDQVGSHWDRDGVLRELDLDVPGGLHYTSAREFNGDLLLWSSDSHLKDTYTLELCLLDLETGRVAASRKVDFSHYVSPQILGDRIYLTDGEAGTVLALNTGLETVKSYSFTPCEGNFYMGANETLYIYHWDGALKAMDLATGEAALLLEDVQADYLFGASECVTLSYADPLTGAERKMALDLTTGKMLEPELDAKYSDISYSNGTWLCSGFEDGYTVYLGRDGEEFLRAQLGYNALELLDGQTMLLTKDEGTVLSLHDLAGRSLAVATLTEMPYSYAATELISSNIFGGYFVVVTDHSGMIRLLYWDVSKSGAGEDIAFEALPEPDAQEAAIRDRVAQISAAYGLNILVGNDCNTQFYDFTAEYVTDWEIVSQALDTLEDALQDYPEGFFRQLRYDGIHSINIHLVGNIAATTEEYVHTYTAFVQYEYDRFTMGVDIFTAQEQTYYHEFSHVIDSYLEWDSNHRENALFSEEGWNEINPLWFPGYTFDYSQEVELFDNYSFIDSYSTIKPTEDRARVMEYAMVDYGFYTFEDNDILIEKLRYYCRCIRDAFDTTGWPETVLWEQYLEDLTE